MACKFFSNCHKFPKTISLYLLKKKFTYKWTHAVQTCAIQGSTLNAKENKRLIKVILDMEHQSILKIENELNKRAIKKTKKTTLEEIIEEKFPIRRKVLDPRAQQFLHTNNYGIISNMTYSGEVFEP